MSYRYEIRKEEIKKEFSNQNQIIILLNELKLEIIRKIISEEIKTIHYEIKKIFL